MFTLSFRTENDAFADDPAGEAARILRDLADRLEAGLTEGGVYDLNGNKVGVFLLNDRPTEDR